MEISAKAPSQGVESRPRLSSAGSHEAEPRGQKPSGPSQVGDRVSPPSPSQAGRWRGGLRTARVCEPSIAEPSEAVAKAVASPAVAEVPAQTDRDRPGDRCERGQNGKESLGSDELAAATPESPNEPFLFSGELPSDRQPPSSSESSSSLSVSSSTSVSSVTVSSSDSSTVSSQSVSLASSLSLSPPASLWSASSPSCLLEPPLPAAGLSPTSSVKCQERPGVTMRRSTRLQVSAVSQSQQVAFSPSAGLVARPTAPAGTRGRKARLGAPSFASSLASGATGSAGGLSGVSLLPLPLGSAVGGRRQGRKRRSQGLPQEARESTVETSAGDGASPLSPASAQKRERGKRVKVEGGKQEPFSVGPVSSDARVSLSPAASSIASSRRPQQRSPSSGSSSFPFFLQEESGNSLDCTLAPHASDAPWHHPLWPASAPRPPCLARDSPVWGGASASLAARERQNWQAFFARWVATTFGARAAREPSLPRSAEGEEAAVSAGGEGERSGAASEADHVGAAAVDIRLLFNCLLYGHPQGLFKRKEAGAEAPRGKRRRTEEGHAATQHQRAVPASASSATPPAAQPSQGGSSEPVGSGGKSALRDPSAARREAAVASTGSAGDGTARDGRDVQGEAMSCTSPALIPCRLFFSPAPPAPLAPRRRQPTSLSARYRRMYGARDGRDLLQVYRHLTKLCLSAGDGSSSANSGDSEKATAESDQRGESDVEVMEAVQPTGRRQKGLAEAEEGPRRAVVAPASSALQTQEGRRGKGHGVKTATEEDETACLEGERCDRRKRRAGCEGHSEKTTDKRRWEMALQVLSRLKVGHSCEAIFLGLGDLPFANRKKLFFRRIFNFRWSPKKKLSASPLPLAPCDAPANAAQAADAASPSASGASGSADTGNAKASATPGASPREETKQACANESRSGRGKKKDESKRALASSASPPPPKWQKRTNQECKETAPWATLVDPADSQSLFLSSWPSLAPHVEAEDASGCGGSTVATEEASGERTGGDRHREVSVTSSGSVRVSSAGAKRVALEAPPRPYRPLCLLSLLHMSRLVRRAQFLRYLREQMEPECASLLHLLLLKGHLRVKCDHDSDRRVEFDRHVSWLLSRLPGDPQLLRYAWWGRGGSPGLQRGLQISEKKGDPAAQWMSFPPLHSPPSLYPAPAAPNAGPAPSRTALAHPAEGRADRPARSDDGDRALEDAAAVGAALAAAAAGAINGPTPGIRWGGGLPEGLTSRLRGRGSSGDRDTGADTGKGGVTASGAGAAVVVGTATSGGAAGLQSGPVLGSSQRRLLRLFRRVCPADVLHRALTTGSVSLSWPTATELQVLRLPELLLDQQVMRLADAFVWSFEGWVGNLVAVAPFLNVYTPHRRTQIGIKKRLGVRQLPNALLTKGSPPPPADFDDAHSSSSSSGVSRPFSASGPVPGLPLSPQTVSAAKDQNGSGGARKRRRVAARETEDAGVA
ncbi:hypothetical protein BESB_054340 [Besnoitia besnoiti]|uniref:Uncharacterized protein n=1 Tax=Besnoitia besnoiti TaxID=94643 RepID=A0A2A9MJF3_BESBE|nr:hypothetical protein BESB_054340 [Besnoitia besnoiti]PFH35783.1 hypothetical protein BESB_054340 [Besnoitia besnoiti]